MTSSVSVAAHALLLSVALAIPLSWPSIDVRHPIPFPPVVTLSASALPPPWEAGSHRVHAVHRSDVDALVLSACPLASSTADASRCVYDVEAAWVSHVAKFTGIHPCACAFECVDRACMLAFVCDVVSQPGNTDIEVNGKLPVQELVMVPLEMVTRFVHSGTTPKIVADSVESVVATLQGTRALSVGRIGFFQHIRPMEPAPQVSCGLFGALAT
jgi:hypothetical protein